MSVSVIVCAAGKGERAGFSQNKLFKPVLGTPLLALTLQAFELDCIDEIIVATAKCDYDEVIEICKDFKAVKVVLGGASRAETVKNALQTVLGEIVLIHDGARPFVSKEVIENCIRSVQENGSGIFSAPVAD